MKNKFLILSAIASMLLFNSCQKTKATLKTGAAADSSQSSKSKTNSLSAIFTNALPSIDNGSYYDPWVIRVGSYYYYCGSDGGRLWIAKSSALQSILQQSKTYIFTPPAGTSYSSDLWAPELHFLGGRWYVYFAADDGNNNNHRMHVLEGGIDANDPLNGGYNYKAKLAATTDNWAIDGSPFVYNGVTYFIWSGWEGTTNVSQYLYIATMSNPYTINSQRVEISRPDYAWEKVGTPTVNEGPETLVSGTTVSVIYSASGSWTNDYCLGRLTCTNGNLMSKASWTKQSTPAFAKFGNVFGPGHASFVKSPDNIQWWIVYHAANADGSGWDRRIMTQQFAWDGDVPFLGYPIEKGIPIPAPSIGTSYSMPIANGTYRIKSKVTGQCLDVPSGSTTPGTQLQEWTDNGNIAQKWVFTSLGNGYYKIKSAASNLCLDDAGNSLSAGNILIEWNDVGGNAQEWRVQDMGSGYFKIISRRSLLALNVPNSNTTPGTKLEQWYENQYDAELWSIVP
ncbi:family 43 glycosylhydrolase [Mucilaginibacter ginsenosidivorax]|uniref:Family 43 glycosylhydrolase n=1 Tax=Mucilaginibacter ginsenosidivorax TaxID=862126 RepID=A0A5B8VVT3_9SPHI|nr:family 43 glycosylhydrolase [Mucilaginibacter ginsenosidivorax]QEC75363.1 family 43 glycosylhydrolase [Mucilaginibacter ginsenosidivorax]